MTVFIKTDVKTDLNKKGCDMIDKTINSNKLSLLNQMIENNDINIDTLLFGLYWIKNNSMDSLYYYDAIYCSECENNCNDCSNCYKNYVSMLEYDLTDINNVGYGIGYSIELVYDVLNKKYDKIELKHLNNVALLDLFNLNKVMALDSLLKLLEPFYNRMALKYIELTLKSKISENDKINFLIDIMESLGFKLTNNQLNLL